MQAAKMFYGADPFDSLRMEVSGFRFQVSEKEKWNIPILKPETLAQAWVYLVTAANGTERNKLAHYSQAQQVAPGHHARFQKGITHAI
jgi:uncharacterized membrane protein